MIRFKPRHTLCEKVRGIPRGKNRGYYILRVDIQFQPFHKFDIHVLFAEYTFPKVLNSNTECDLKIL